MTHEYKRTPTTEIKLSVGDKMEFSGYGAVFNNIDAYGDVIEKGAFKDTLERAKATGDYPAMLLEHGGFGMAADDMVPIGVWTELVEDDRGLKVAGHLADTQRGREAYALLKMQPRPAITGLSIGYIAKQSEPRSKPEDPKRRITKIDLFEVSLVTFPANPSARVADVKSGGVTRRELERMLMQDAGLTRSQAREILSRRFPSLAMQDAGTDDVNVDALHRLVKSMLT